MSSWTLSDWSNAAQVSATIVALVGVVVSIWVALRTLREFEDDRSLRHRPYLAFEPGGHRVGIEFSARGPLVAGVAPEAARRLIGHLAPDGESIVLVRDRDVPGSGLYGRLKNYGAGPALEVRVEWVPERVTIGSDSFEVTSDKRLDPLYGAALNTMPTLPSHVEPGTAGQLSRIPAFIVKDYEKKITRVDGHLLIVCRDIFRAEHRASQTFHLFTQYRDHPPSVHVTFSSLRSDGVA